VIFGLLGAAFSTLLNLYKGNSLSTNVIKALDSFILTVARLIIGASAGLIAFYLLNSGLIIIKGFNEETLDKINDQNSGPVALKLSMLALIFVAGFTERFVLNFVEKISNQQQTENRSQAEEEAKAKAKIKAEEDAKAEEGAKAKTQAEDNTQSGKNTKAESNIQEEDKSQDPNKPRDEEEIPPVN
jgi:hypothetical protein